MMPMKTSLAFAAIIWTVFLARTAGAQQRFTGVEYIAGRTELARPFEATLVLDDHELRIEETVYSRQGRSVRTVFTIPLTDITDVGASLDREPGNPILTGRFGLSSPTDHHEYVTLTMAVGDRIEGVVFAVGRQQSADIARNIQIAVLNAHDPQPPPAKRVRAATRARRPLHLVRLVSRPSKREPIARIRVPRSHGHSRTHAERLYFEQA
jgi:hypothetical protein